MTGKSSFLWAAAALFMVSPVAASAQPPDPPEYKFGAGIFMRYSSSPYEDYGSDIKVLPSFSYTGERLTVRGPFAALNVYQTRPLRINLTAEYVFEEDAFEESAALAGMDTRGNTAMLGIDAGYRFADVYRIDAQVKSDALGRFDGQLASLTLSRFKRLYKTTLVPGAGIEWQSSNYTEHFYGVPRDEAAPGRPPYDPGAGYVWFLQFLATHPLSERVSLAAVVRLRFLSGEFQDSPIISDDHQATGFLSVTYGF